MKFGKYLKDARVPEWRHAYIPYSSYKKQIKTWSTAETDNGTDLILEEMIRTDLNKMLDFFKTKES